MCDSYGPDPGTGGATTDDSDAAGFLHKVLRLLENENVLGTRARPCASVVDFEHPQELKNSLQLEIGVLPERDDTLLQMCQEVLRMSVKTGHPYCFIGSGVDSHALGGSWIGEALNTNITTFEIAPVFIVMEKAVIDHLLQLCGWDSGEGMMAPGHAICNMYGLVTARYKKYPMVKTEGVQSLPRMAVFGSEQSDTSLQRIASFVGLGLDNVVLIETDNRGCMDPIALDKAICRATKEGVVPILVCATSGTPTLGSCDALDRIANVCQNHQVWLHVDAYNLGGVLLSDVHRHLMHGINMADSVAWSPHGLLGVPLDCTVFLIKEKGLLDSCNKLEVPYLFQRDKFYDVAYDIGDQSVQCGRKVDSGKLWIMWKAKGDIGMAKLVESAFTQARYFMDELTIRDGFRPVLPEFQGNKVGFWYIPPRHRNMNETEDWWAEIGKVSLAIKERLTLKGSVILNCESVKRKGLSHFLQLTTDSSSPVSQQGVKVVLDEIVNASNNL